MTTDTDQTPNGEPIKAVMKREKQKQGGSVRDQRNRQRDSEERVRDVFEEMERNRRSGVPFDTDEEEY